MKYACPKRQNVRKNTGKTFFFLEDNNNNNNAFLLCEN